MFSDLASMSKAESLLEMQHERNEFFPASPHRDDLSRPCDQFSSHDPRVLGLTDVIFRELYVQRLDLFEKLFPGPQERIQKKFTRKLSDLRLRRRMKSRSAILRRSLSVGSPRIYRLRGGGGGDESEEEPLKLHRFKVRIVDADESDDFPYDPPQGSQTGTNN
ncbi:uncharacterized protein LOC116197078 [Punica granatum]|uniref:Uncharacterized protein LOC116197078 n=1 Tax=Punica granatum TaxID=22663 RepID=A0A218WCU7_PUNGR|nr:uncharacterized protein LOC116197078 [Punica granatum]OWM70288.1 hypothetical protein CDL15_Pgr026138 [Punica granatum]